MLIVKTLITSRNEAIQTQKSEREKKANCHCPCHCHYAIVKSICISFA